MQWDWVYLAQKTHEGAELMLIPAENLSTKPRKTKYLKLSLEVLVVLFRLYF